MPHRLKAGVIEPPLLLEDIHGFDLLRALQTDGSEILANQGVILLRDKAVVIFLRGPPSAQLETGDGLAPEADQMVIEALGAIIGGQCFDGKGDPLQDVAKACFHRLRSFAQQGHPLPPASGRIHHWSGKGVDPLAVLSTMLDQIDFEVARLPRVPGNALHRHGLADLIGWSWSLLWQALFLTAIGAQDPGHGRLAALRALLFDWLTQMQRAKTSQMLGGAKPRRGESFGANVIQAFP